MTLPINKIICGDNVDVLRTFPDNSIDMVLTSPPYDNLRDYKGFSFDFESLAFELFRVLKQGGTMVWIVGDATIDGGESGTSFRQALHFMDIGFNLHDTMIWKKISPFQHKNRYISCFEYMFVFSKGSPTANLIQDRKNKTAGDTVNGTDRQKDGKTKKRSDVQKLKFVKEYGSRFNIWEIPSVMSSKERLGHPAPFPEQLAADHIISWSNETDIILDPFSGSGTTCKMSKLWNRQYIGIDCSQEYCEIAKARIERIPPTLWDATE